MNWDKLLQDMLNAARDVLASKWPMVAGTTPLILRHAIEMSQYVEKHRSEITEMSYQHQVTEIRDYLKNMMGGIAAIDAVIAKQAANAAFDILVKALNTAMGFPLLKLGV